MSFGMIATWQAHQRSGIKLLGIHRPNATRIDGFWRRMTCVMHGVNAIPTLSATTHTMAGVASAEAAAQAGE